MKKRRWILILLVFFLTAGIIIAYLISNMDREMKLFAETKGKTTLALVLQNALYDYMKNEDGNYVEIAKDASNRITSIHIHSIPLSLLASRLTVILLEELEEYKSDGFGIPLGNLTSVAYFSGKGPVIPVTAVTLGTVAHTVDTELTSTGINQTLHRVSIRYAVTIRYLSPLHEYVDSMTLEVLIAETLVVGDVPIYKD